ncbi:MAG: apolipoprotein N-acyltransferase [Candidatus Hydrogenedentes bacterium]|nr:apolipoprotein N-acyltransferase [Candidatus Hydrogenedentota bacterium]
MACLFIEARHGLHLSYALTHDALSMKSILRFIPAYVVTGAALGLAFPAAHLFPLAWVALVPLFVSTWRCGARDSFRRFFLAGFLFYLVILHWLLTNVYWAGGWAVWGYVALSAIMALYWGIIGWSWALVRSRLPWVPPVLVLVVLWVGMEHAQSFLFTGFGWGALGYSQGPDLALAQWAAIGGVPLLSGLLVGVNGLLAGVIADGTRRVPRIACAICVVAGAHGAGAMMLAPADYGEQTFNVGLIQSDFPLEMKWDPEYTSEMVRNAADKSRVLAGEGDVDLFVWPESLVMDDIETPGIWEPIESMTRETGVPLFTGTMRTNAQTRGDLNSSQLIAPDGQIKATYDKIHLAPFGEYVPFGKYLPFIKKVVPAIGEVEAGTELKTIAVGERTMGPLICFEVLFPAMASRLRAEGADFLVVITNLAWFGASSALDQELEVARMRAIEARMPLVHDANSGITGVFDPYGRFELVDIYFDGHGNAYRFEHLEPTNTRMERLGGVLPVSHAAERPVPFSVLAIPNATLVAGIALTVLAGVYRRRDAGAQ